ncbi:hypothetical protein CU633_10850 [Bacillus sp. V3-13]|nr:hypothetical protein CU633_10850 [Bacillus sp. V3-13]
MDTKNDDSLFYSNYADLMPQLLLFNPEINNDLLPDNPFKKMEIFYTIKFAGFFLRGIFFDYN